MSETKSIFKGWHRILLIILPYFLIVGIFQLVGGLIAGVNMKILNPELSSIQHLIMSLFTLVGTLIVLWIFMKWVDKESFVKLGFHTKNRFKDFTIGIVIGFIIMAIGYIVLIYLKEIYFFKFFFDIKELMISILIFTIVAFFEETFFRGYILKNLMLSSNRYIALIITSILFSLNHYSNPNIDLISIINLFLAGMLLGISYIYTRNLWFPIALHLSWNLFQTLFGFNVSGYHNYSLIEFTIKDANLLNGGAFGFEGSYLAIIAQIITISGIVVYYNRKKLNGLNHSSQTSIKQNE